jgi:hypothetical protein
MSTDMEFPAKIGRDTLGEIEPHGGTRGRGEKGRRGEWEKGRKGEWEKNDEEVTFERRLLSHYFALRSWHFEFSPSPLLPVVLSRVLFSAKSDRLAFPVNFPTAKIR